MWDIQLFKLNFDNKEVKAVTEVVSGGWLSMGERILEFENDFSESILQGAYCKAVSNCTAALHMSLLALDIKKGDEVIIPSITFVADANVVNLVGATPVLADSTSIDDWNISLKSIEKKVTKKTRAIIVVHYAGYPCVEIEQIRKFCKEKGIGLIEDVAHAPGASINGQACGTFGDIGCFSFFSNKNLSIGEGGMVSSLNPDIDKKLGYLRSHGMTTLTMDRHKGRSISYDVIQSGLNYRMDEIRAAIGSVQLKKLKNGNAKREKLTKLYRDNFKNSPILIPFTNQPKNSVSAYHILPILLPKNVDRISVIETLKKNRIQSSIHYPPFWEFSAFAGLFAPNDSPITADICKRQLTLPLYPTMKQKEVNKVCEILLKAF